MSAALIATILLQRRGSGLGGAFGGASAGYYQKRGAEKILFYLSVILGILFIGFAFLLLISVKSS